MENKKGIVGFFSGNAVRIGLLSAILVAGVIGGFFLFDKVQDNVELNLDPNQQAYTGEEPQNVGGASEGIEIPGYGSINIPADTTDVSITLHNPSKNGEGDKTYNMTFELILKDTGESLWKSEGAIRPGNMVNKQTLKHGLSAGEYNAIIKVQPYTADGTATNSADMETKLIVQ